MKLIIEIPEKDYNNIKPFLNGETIKGGFNLFKALEIIKNGIPLDGKTNGEIIQKLFPKIDKAFSNVIDLNLWWNAKYKTGSKGEE
jgi:hypothetical protein